MNKRFKIDVWLDPDTTHYPDTPYFWVIFESNDHANWCNAGTGYAETPEKAWAEAYEFYNKYHKTTSGRK